MSEPANQNIQPFASKISLTKHEPDHDAVSAYFWGSAAFATVLPTPSDLIQMAQQNATANPGGKR